MISLGSTIKSYLLNIDIRSSSTRTPYKVSVTRPRVYQTRAFKMKKQWDRKNNYYLLLYCKIVINDVVVDVVAESFFDLTYSSRVH